MTDLTIEELHPLLAMRRTDNQDETIALLAKQLLASMQENQRLRLYIDSLPDQSHWLGTGYNSYYEWVCEGVKQCNEVWV